MHWEGLDTSLEDGWKRKSDKLMKDFADKLSENMSGKGQQLMVRILDELLKLEAN